MAGRRLAEIWFRPFGGLGTYPRSVGDRVRSLAIVACAVIVLLPSVADAANVNGNSGANVLFGTNNDDLIRAAGGDDILFGKAGADALVGATGNDLLFGGAGADLLDGGEGNDTIYDDDSQPGDKLRGRAGDDILFSLDGAPDKVNCGEGFDVAFLDPSDTFTGCERRIRSNANFQGGRVNVGSNGNDILDLGGVANIVFGRKGTDLIRAGEGDDLILGGAGGDSMVGEDDDDEFVDDDSVAGDAIRPGDGDDLIFMADGARTSVDCSDADDDGDDDVVYADAGDAIIDCGTVIRG
jgi:Ca2+-binding RTX toxin-like protein